MWRAAAAFLRAGLRGFESGFLQQRVSEPSVPLRRTVNPLGRINTAALFTAVPKVRIRFPPAVSLQTFGSARDVLSRGQRLGTRDCVVGDDKVALPVIGPVRLFTRQRKRGGAGQRGGEERSRGTSGHGVVNR